MAIKIMINGAFGRMGKLACEAIYNHPDFELVAKAGRKHSEQKSDLIKLIQNTQPDIILDLTTAECVWENANFILDQNITPVIGTSGLDKDQISQLCAKAREKNLGGLIIPNFSIGAVLQIKYAAEIAKYFNKTEIIEKHHETKLDSPSGTAIATAEKISKNISAENLAQKAIPIHSVRLPGIIANQQVIFGSSSETLTIEHNIANRSAFMPGIILACQKAKGFDTIRVGLDPCLNTEQA